MPVWRNISAFHLWRKCSMRTKSKDFSLVQTDVCQQVLFLAQILQLNITHAGVAEWQTRLFKGQVGNRVGSTPTTCTKDK